MGYGRRYSGDPRWIRARGVSMCVNGHRIENGEPLFWYPRGLYAFCEREACGEAESARFEAAAFDEAVMTGEW